MGKDFGKATKLIEDLKQREQIKEKVAITNLIKHLSIPEYLRDAMIEGETSLLSDKMMESIKSDPNEFTLWYLTIKYTGKIADETIDELISKTKTWTAKYWLQAPYTNANHLDRIFKTKLSEYLPSEIRVIANADIVPFPSHIQISPHVIEYMLTNLSPAEIEEKYEGIPFSLFIPRATASSQNVMRKIENIIAASDDGEQTMSAIASNKHLHDKFRNVAFNAGCDWDKIKHMTEHMAGDMYASAVQTYFDDMLTSEEKKKMKYAALKARSAHTIDKVLPYLSPAQVRDLVSRAINTGDDFILKKIAFSMKLTQAMPTQELVDNTNPAIKNSDVYRRILLDRIACTTDKFLIRHAEGVYNTIRHYATYEELLPTLLNILNADDTNHPDIDFFVKEFKGAPESTNIILGAFYDNFAPQMQYYFRTHGGQAASDIRRITERLDKDNYPNPDRVLCYKATKKAVLSYILLRYNKIELQDNEKELLTKMQDFSLTTYHEINSIGKSLDKVKPSLPEELCKVVEEAQEYMLNEAKKNMLTQTYHNGLAFFTYELDKDRKRIPIISDNKLKRYSGKDMAHDIESIKYAPLPAIQEVKEVILSAIEKNIMDGEWDEATFMIYKTAKIYEALCERERKLSYLSAEKEEKDTEKEFEK